MEAQPPSNVRSSASSASNLSDYFKVNTTATLKSAERHHQANRVTQLRDIQVSTLTADSRCECCLFPVDAQPFRLTALDSLSELGIAFPLYFHLTRHIVLVLTIVSVVAAVPATICNLTLGTTSSLPITRFSIVKHDRELPIWPIALHLIAIILICLIYIYTTLRMKALMILLDDGISTPAQFAVLVKNLGTDWNSADLKKHIEEKLQVDGKSIRVQQIYTCYDIDEFERITKSIRKIKTKQEKFRSQQLQPSLFRRCWDRLLCVSTCHAGRITEEQLKADMVRLEEQIATIAKQEWKQTGVAVVVLETNFQAKAFFAKWKRGPLRRYIFCCLAVMDEDLIFNNRRIYVKKAPEPNDVAWKNLKHSRLKRLLTQLLAIAVVIGVLYCNYYCLSIIANQKAGIKSREIDKKKTNGDVLKGSAFGSCKYSPDDYNDDYNDDDYSYATNYIADEPGELLSQESMFVPIRKKDAELEIKETAFLAAEADDSDTTEEHRACYSDQTSLISFAVAYSIFLLNIIIKIVSRAISVIEHHQSYTTESLFVSWKLIIFLSFNLILSPLLVNIRLPNLNTEEGLAPDVLYTVAIQAFVIPFTKFTKPLFYVIKKWYVSSRVLANKFFSSQESLNKDFEFPEVDLSVWYVTLICNLLLTLAYTPLIPLVAPIMCVGLVLEYWINKFLLLRLSCRPKPISNKITKIVMQFVKPAIVLYAVGMMVSSMSTVSEEGRSVCIAALVFSCIFWCIPVSIFRLCFRKVLPESKGQEEMKYEDAVNSFFIVSNSQRYELSNPVTRVQELANQNQDTSALKQYIFEHEKKPEIPAATLCFPSTLSRRQSKVAERSISDSYVRMSDTQINS